MRERLLPRIPLSQIRVRSMSLRRSRGSLQDMLYVQRRMYVVLVDTGDAKQHNVTWKTLQLL